MTVGCAASQGSGQVRSHQKKSSSKLDEEGIQVAVCRYMGRPEECDCTDDTCQSWCVETHLFINLSESHVYFLMGIPSTDFFFCYKDEVR